MPIWKYVANRFLTLFENLLLGTKLSEYHTGYRAFSRELLEMLPLEKNSDDFVFDNEVLAEVLWLDCAIGEVTCPPSTCRKLLRSIFAEACVTASAVFAPALSTVGPRFADMDACFPRKPKTGENRNSGVLAPECQRWIAQESPNDFITPRLRPLSPARWHADLLALSIW